MPACTIPPPGVPKITIDGEDLSGPTTGGFKITWNAEHPKGLIVLKVLGPFTGTYKEDIILDALYPAPGHTKRYYAKCLSIEEVSSKMEVQTHTYTIELA